MPFLVRNLTLDLSEPEEALLARAAKRLRVPESAVSGWSIVRRAVDARRGEVRFNYQVEINLSEPVKQQRARLRKFKPGIVRWIDAAAPPVPAAGTEKLRGPVIVVGFGPAGMFAALRLAERGYAPIVVERGRDVRRRHRDIMQDFYRDGKFSETSNLLYGEGGAGTYSDGKLYTRVSDPLCREVLEILYRHGADPDILIDTRPHIGSDRLPTVCTRIRQRIESLGGSVRFDSCVSDIRTSPSGLSHVQLTRTDGTEQREWVECGALLLGIGHSARDTLRMLHERGVRLSPKPFQLGVRIEHPQEMVDKWQYGSCAGHERLAPAEYHLVSKGAAGSRGDMFSFCMCPGGVILPTNESAGLISTNGASRANRSSGLANSGLVITIDPAEIDYAKFTSSPARSDAEIALSALEYQAHWERRAFELTGESYRVPMQRASDFLNGAQSDGAPTTSYPLGGIWVSITDVVPAEVAAALGSALPKLDHKFPGYASAEGVITGPETRASGPVRILRDAESRESVSTSGLYPIGEGAGYAGGIISAAIDGMKTADAITARFAPDR